MIRGPVVGMYPYPSHSRIKNTPCSAHTHFHISYNTFHSASALPTLSTLPFSVVSCFLCYGKVLKQERRSLPLQSFRFTSIFNPPILHFYPPLHFCTKNTGFCYGRESMTSHIKHTSERDPHAMTRGPTLSLYKSNCSQLPRKPGP